MDGWWLCLRWEERERPPTGEVWMGGGSNVGDEGRDGIGERRGMRRRTGSGGGGGGEEMGDQS